MTITAARQTQTAWRGLAAISVLFGVVLLATSGGYGYHRDELYFIQIGAHPAFGYVDQPPLIPLLARAMDVLGGHSLFWLRVPAALAGAAVVVLTGLIAREFGATRGAQVLAGSCMAVGAVLVTVGHMLSTATFDLLLWTLLTWLIVRAVRDGGRIWLLIGLVAGVSLEVKTLPIFLFAALLAGLVVNGQRSVLASRWLWGGALIAAGLWAPDLIWQAAHHWPQLQLSSDIAAGRSGSSQPRWVFVPYQLILVSPLVAPIWLTGLWRLLRDPALTPWRFVGVAYPVLVAVFVMTGGKPYYLAGMYPVLIAAGAASAWSWLRTRRAVLGAVLGLSAAVSAVLMLPIVPVADLHSTPVVAVNYDAGETVGWPRLVATVDAAYRAAPGPAVVLTANYGEAGAVSHFAPTVPVFSGHNSLADYGPPPAGTATVIAVGYETATLSRWFGRVDQVATIDDGVGLDNDEQGAAVYRCSDPLATWARLWPQMRRLT